MKITRTDTGRHGWFQSLNCDAAYGVALAGTLLVLLGLAFAGPRAGLALRYERAGLLQHQWWRLLGAHCVHLNLRHALLNCAGLVLLWVLFARDYPPRRWLWILLVSIAAIDAGLWYLRPQVEWYLGASGVLHGVLAAGACAWYRRGETLGAGLLLLLVSKLIYEQHAGGSLFDRDLPLVPDAHLFGACGGLLAAYMPRLQAKRL